MVNNYLYRWRRTNSWEEKKELGKSAKKREEKVQVGK